MHTTDFIYGQKLSIRQPAKGFRVCMDTIFLAASVPAEGASLALDVGAGVGASALCLAYRCPEVIVHGIELQRENVHLAFENIQNNHMRGRVEVLCGDVEQPPPRLSAGAYDHVFSNPPFFEGEGSAIMQKKLSSHRNGNLEAWIQFCLRMAKSQAILTFIYPTERIQDILYLLKDNVGHLVLFPLWPRAGEPARRVLISGIKGNFRHTPTKILPGMVLHQDDGSYTKCADAILRHQQPLLLR